MSKERVRGFFWVRFSNLSEWEIAKYIPGFGWSLFWTEEYLKDSRLHQIDERPIVMEEPSLKKVTTSTCKYCGCPLSDDSDEIYQHHQECQEVFVKKGKP